MTITADGDDTNGEFTVVDMLAPAGFENGVHTHEPTELFHVLEGEMRLHVDGEDRYLRPGATGYVASGQHHGFSVEGDGTLRVLLTFSPAGPEDVFRAVGDPVASRRDVSEARDVTAADLKALFEVGVE